MLTDPSLLGSLFKLSCHRYGSHVLESILVALQGVATQEERQQSSLSRPMPSSGTVDQSGHGTLRTAHELISNLTEVRSSLGTCSLHT